MKAKETNGMCFIMTSTKSIINSTIINMTSINTISYYYLFIFDSSTTCQPYFSLRTQALFWGYQIYIFFDEAPCLSHEYTTDVTWRCWINNILYGKTSSELKTISQLSTDWNNSLRLFASNYIYIRGTLNGISGL